MDQLRRILVPVDFEAASMAVSIALTVLAFSGGSQVWQVYVLALFAGIAQVFDSPGRHALVYQMVGRAELPNAIALNTSVFNASRRTVRDTPKRSSNSASPGSIEFSG